MNSLVTTRHQQASPSTMSTPARPSTPVAQTPASTPQTGTWRHPKMDEIVRRQNAASFSDRNMRNILWNVGGIVALFFVARSIWNKFVPHPCEIPVLMNTAFQASSRTASRWSHMVDTSIGRSSLYSCTTLPRPVCHYFERRTICQTYLLHLLSESCLDSLQVRHHPPQVHTTLHLHDMPELLHL
jgi:hypothetical protein